MLSVASTFRLARPPRSLLPRLFSATTAIHVPALDFPLKGVDLATVAPRVRFAPSPTGSLHVGGARTALYNWLIAAKARSLGQSGSSFIIRSEDTDVVRSTKEFESMVLRDLEWLGLAWDEGPATPNQSFGPYRQSERLPLYQKLAKYLVDTGKAYPCFCDAEELEKEKEAQAAAGEVQRYGGKWRDADPALVAANLAAGVPHTIRFRVVPGSKVVIDDVVRGIISWDADATVGDFILLRSSGIPVYNFCVACDDALMGVTTVVRAEEHLTNTLRQGLVLDSLGVPRPEYAHCSLILGEDRQKLSKRHGATSCDQFRKDGFLPDAMINYLSLLGWNDGTDVEIFSRDELVEAFDMSRVVPSSAVFDMSKLLWVNAQHLKLQSIEEVSSLVLQQMIDRDIVTDGGKDERIARASTALAKQMMETTVQPITNLQSVLDYQLQSIKSFDNLSPTSEERRLIIEGHFFGVATKLLEAYDAKTLPKPDEANLMCVFESDKTKALIAEDTETGGGAYSFAPAYKTFMKKLGKELDVKGKNLFHPARLALTGTMSGQDVTKQLSVLTLCTQSQSALNFEKIVVVPLQARMEVLRSFLDTIPEEFRQPLKVKVSEAEEVAGVAPVSESSPAAPQSDYEGPPFSAMDMRVGVITKVWHHEDSDKLFCEEVDVGEESPRLIASGLRPFFSTEDLLERKVLVLCNLKERKLAGFPSHGMVLCAGNEDHTAVKFVAPPADAKVGERVTWGNRGEMEEAEKENKFAKKKMFEKIAVELKTDEYGVCSFLGKPLMTSAGACVSELKGASIS